MSLPFPAWGTNSGNDLFEIHRNTLYPNPDKPEPKTILTTKGTKYTKKFKKKIPILI